MAEQALIQLKLDRLFILPCGEPPHKSSHTSKFDRLEMTRLAFEKIKGAEVDSYEIEKEGKGYTYQTLLHFKELYPAAKLYFIIGGDSLRDFGTWKNPQIISDAATLALCRRKGLEYLPYIAKARHDYNAKIKMVDITLSDVSSRAVRVDCEFFNALSFVPSASGKSSFEFIPQSVKEYILNNRLFTKYGGAIKKLSSLLDGERLSHTYYVVQTALALSGGLDEEKVFTAALLHDCAKQIKKEQWGKYDFNDGCCEKVAHAKLGAIVAKQDFGVSDKEVLDAIYYHSTARKNMTKLDMVIFLADKLEPSREYPVSHLFKESLEETFKAVLSEVVLRLKERGGKIDPLSFEAEEFYLKDANK